MAVKYQQGGGGGYFNPFGILSTLAMLIPGAQAASPFLSGAGAVTSAINGDWGGAAITGAGLLKNAGGKSIFGTDTSPSVTDPAQAPVTDMVGQEPETSIFSSAEDRAANNLSRYLSANNLGTYTPDDEVKYQDLLRRYGLIAAPQQAVGMDADMGTRFADNNLMGQRRSDADYQNRYKELLAQYNLSDMDWTNRRKRNGLIGGI